MSFKLVSFLHILQITSNETQDRKKLQSNVVATLCS